MTQSLQDRLNLNGPIFTFYRNMKAHGVTFAINDCGKLIVTMPDELKENIFLQEEIIKRVAWLKELTEMEGLIGRPLGPIDTDRLRTLSAKYGYELVWERIPLCGE